MAGMEGMERPLGITIFDKRATLDNQSPSRSVDLQRTWQRWLTGSLDGNCQSWFVIIPM
jgi:hypothetical protein